MKAFKVFTLVVILLLSNDIFGGSNYQIGELGKINYFSQADIMGRGGTSIAIFDRTAINTVNPAGLIFVNLTRISGDFYHEKIDYKTSSVNGVVNYSNLHGVRLLVPIAVKKFVISLGIRPYSRRDFIKEGSGELSTGNEYVRQIVNKGGLNQVSFGMASGYKDKVFAGLFLNYNFGKLEENWKVDYVSDYYYDTFDNVVSTLWGSSITAGLMVKIKPNFYVGGVFSPKAKLYFNKKIEYTFGGEEDIEKENMKLPYSWGLGASYILKDKIRFSCDYFSQPWSKFEIDNTKLNKYNNSHNISSGVEFRLSEKTFDSYYKRISYRAGFHYSKQCYKDDNGYDVSEYLGTFGVGLPFYSGVGRLDIALGFGKRGNLNDNTVEESLFQLMISISGGEKWFHRRKQN